MASWKPFNVAVIMLFHVTALYGFSLLVTGKFCWPTLVATCCLYFFSALGITAGVHRLWSHKSYTATMPLQIFLMFCNNLAFQGSIFQWSRDHRVHHKCSETNGDPHNAERGFFFAHMGWLLQAKHPEVIRHGKMLDLSDLKSDPVVMFQHNFYFPLAFTMCYLFPAALCGLWGDSWAGLWIAGALRYVTVLHATWCINSVAHMWGDRPYSIGIHPRENWFATFFSIGEGWHNYHHLWPYDYSASEWGFTQYNPTSCFIDLMCFLGLAHGRRTVNKALIAKKKAIVQSTCAPAVHIGRKH